MHMLEEIRALYTGKEMKVIFDKMGAGDCRIKTPFPYLTQIVIAQR